VRTTKIRITCSGPIETRVFESLQNQVIIGRPKVGKAIDLDLSPDMTVSRPHARIWLEDGKCWIEDLNSQSGTRIGGEEIKGKGRRQLGGNDQVSVGKTLLEVELLEEDLPPPWDPNLPVTGALDATEPVSMENQGCSGPEAERLGLLYELPLSFGAEEKMDVLLETIVRRLVEVIGAAGGAIGLVDPKTDELLLPAWLSSIGIPPLSTSLARRAMEDCLRP
jgi:hypothetical protein